VNCHLHLFITDFKIHGTKRNYNNEIAQFSNLDISTQFPLLDIEIMPCLPNVVCVSNHCHIFNSKKKNPRSHRECAGDTLQHIKCHMNHSLHIGSRFFDIMCSFVMKVSCFLKAYYIELHQFVMFKLDWRLLS